LAGDLYVDELITTGQQTGSYALVATQPRLGMLEQHRCQLVRCCRRKTPRTAETAGIHPDRVDQLAATTMFHLNAFVQPPATPADDARRAKLLNRLAVVAYATYDS
jgi:hypothetical protein